MDQPAFQQAWNYSVPQSDQQHHLMAQYDNDPEDLSLTFADWCDYGWNYMGCSQIATNVPNQAVPPFNPQPDSNPEPQSGLVRHWCAGYAASSSSGQSPDADLPLSAVDAQCQFPANDHSSQQNILPWPQPEPTAELNSIPIPYGDTNYESSLGFEQALTAGDALTTQRLGEPHFNPRQKLWKNQMKIQKKKTKERQKYSDFGRCTRCWALCKPVILFIQ